MSKGYKWLLDHGDDALIIILWDYLCELKGTLVGVMRSLVGLKAKNEEGGDDDDKDGEGGGGLRGEVTPEETVEDDYQSHLALIRQERWCFWVRAHPLRVAQPARPRPLPFAQSAA